MNDLPTPKQAVVIVLNFNGKRFLHDCLESLLNQTYSNSEVVVVDNASYDGSVEYLRDNFPAVRLISNDTNLGVGAGFNAGIMYAMSTDCEYVALLNPDVRADPNWLAELVGTIEMNPDVDVCASLCLEYDGRKVDNAGGRILNIAAGVFGGVASGLPVGEVPAKYVDSEFSVLFGLVTAMAVRASAFESCGLLPEDFFMYFEDIDFSWRVLLSGRRILCNSRAKIYHYCHGTGKTRDIELYITGMAEENLLSTCWRNLSLASLLFLFPLMVIIRSAASLVYLFISPRITLVKLNHILRFHLGVLKGKQSDRRRFAQALRQRSDCQVLRTNPGPLFSLGAPARFFFSWIRGLGKSCGNSRKTVARSDVGRPEDASLEKSDE